MFRVSANKLCGDSEPLQSLITECRENLPNFAKEPVWALYIENATPWELFDFLNYLYAEDDEDLYVKTTLISPLQALIVVPVSQAQAS